MTHTHLLWWQIPGTDANVKTDVACRLSMLELLFRALFPFPRFCTVLSLSLLAHNPNFSSFSSLLLLLFPPPIITVVHSYFSPLLFCLSLLLQTLQIFLLCFSLSFFLQRVVEHRSAVAAAVKQPICHSIASAIAAGNPLACKKNCYLSPAGSTFQQTSPPATETVCVCVCVCVFVIVNL